VTRVTEITDPKVVKALGHPLRRRILAALDGRIASPSELADEFGEQIGNISYHFKTLERLDLIELVETTPRRGAIEHRYRAACVTYVPSEILAAMPEPIRQLVIHTWFRKRQEEVLAAIEAGGFDGVEKQALRARLTLDEKALKELGTKLEEMHKYALGLQKESEERLAQGGEARKATVVLMLFGAEDAAQGNKKNSDRSSRPARPPAKKTRKRS
jgi:DNA-binding transcriptional ArsR family regulator